MNDYNLKLTHLTHYSIDMVANVRNKASLFMCQLSLLYTKKGKAFILVGQILTTLKIDLLSNARRTTPLNPCDSQEN